MRSLVLVACSVVVLNALLSIYVWAPTGAFLLALVPLVETLSLVWLSVGVLRYVRTIRARRFFTFALGAAFGILTGFSAAEAFFRFYFARSLAPRTDIAMIRGALLLFFGDIGRTADLLTPIVIVVLFSVLALCGVVIVSGVFRVLRRAPRPAVALGGLTAAALPLMLAVGLPSSLTELTTISWLRPERESFAPVETRRSVLPEEAAGPGSYTFPGLLDRDIYVFAVEAYGYAAFHRPEISSRLAPYRKRLEEALQKKGYGIRSSYLRSPVAGGYSWLAEATFLTGQWIDSQARFLQLYEANLPTLSGMLYEGGYYTLTLRPGTVHGRWPEGWDLYRFQESIVAHDGDFDYVGPWLSYVAITDQYTLWHGEKRIRELTRSGGPAEERPLFVYYQLVSSHTPYNAIPPLIEDWDDLGNGDVYNKRAAEIRRFDNTWTGGTELVEGYVSALSYVYEVLTSYVENVMDASRNPILIIFGDHQPQRPIRSPELIMSVPIHVASRDEEVLQRFADRGFESGLHSSRRPPHPEMSGFFPMFVDLARATAAEVPADLR